MLDYDMLGVAQEWGLSPEGWDRQSHENKLRMAARALGDKLIEAMRQYDDNEEAKQDAERKRKHRK